MINKIKTAFFKAKVKTQVVTMDVAQKICKKAEKHPKVLAALEGLGLVAVANGINPVVAYAASNPTNTATKKIHQDSGNITISINGNLILDLVGSIVFAYGLFGLLVNVLIVRDDDSSTRMKYFLAIVGGIITITISVASYALAV